MASGSDNQRAGVRTVWYVGIAVSLLVGAVLLTFLSLALDESRGRLPLVAAVMAAIGLLMVAIAWGGGVPGDGSWGSLLNRPGGLVGHSGEVRSCGMVFINGALWKAECDETLSESDRVEIVAVKGLTLIVKKT